MNDEQEKWHIWWNPHEVKPPGSIIPIPAGVSMAEFIAQKNLLPLERKQQTQRPSDTANLEAYQAMRFNRMLNAVGLVLAFLVIALALLRFFSVL